MRIAFMGKGGVGKTTITSLYTLFSSEIRALTLAIDADVNCHLGQTIGFSSEIPHIGDRFEEIAAYLEPIERFRALGLDTVPRFGTIPPTGESRFVRVSSNCPALRRFGAFKDGICLLAVGPHAHDDVGTHCYHSKLNPLELILHHLIDTVEDRVVIDSAAGIDALGTSLYLAYDVVVFIVEPTEESISVMRDYVERIATCQTPIFCIANKCLDDSDRRFIAERIPASVLLGFLNLSKELRRFDQQRGTLRECLTAEVQDLFRALEAHINEKRRDWDSYRENLIDVYRRECDRWWNGIYKTRLNDAFDPSFRFQSVQERS